MTAPMRAARVPTGRLSRRLASASLLLSLCGPALAAQGQPATVREYLRPFPTYPFSDPNPVPVVGRIYPYFRFDGFTDKAEQHEWKVVELENAYIRVLILPEIGGKIWTAIDKRNGKPFIYFNESVKFRDIAMRGPWTSGGIEANYGIIGHTPTVATPVDYATRTNADGSVTCVIGALDLLTRTPWRLEIRLGRDQAYFTTTSFWYNASPLEQPYYTWMNAALSARNDLQFIYPGTSYIGHGGEHASWPINEANRHDISWYRNNDFGGSKSYHVVGEATDFVGAYWHDDDFGMVRYAPRDEKPGKKLWIWGLSRQGMIWEQLLTDRDGQYVELQSGRLFNQTAEQSTFTPFKHHGFAPHTADRWTEYWYPVEGTKGIVAASPAGALNVTAVGDRLALALSPAEPVADSLIVYAGARRLGATYVQRNPLELFADTVNAAGVSRDSIRVVLGDRRLEFNADPNAAALSRPLDAPADFDWHSAYGLYLQGKEWLRQREYDRAVTYIDSALAKDHNFAPALADRAMLALRQARYEEARRFAMAALRVDSYDGAANYYYGLANRRLGRLADAADGLEIASLDIAWRGAAWTELGRMSLAQGNNRRAAQYADKALGAEPGNLDALAVLIVAARRTGDISATESAIAGLEAADPLSHQARLERLLLRGDAAAGTKLRAGVRSELPDQVLLELAAWYADAGERTIAAQVLESLGSQPEAMYLRAELLAQRRDSAAARALIDSANALSPRLAFPFRPESRPALELAAQMSGHWKARYYLGLLDWALGRVPEATSLLVGIGNEADYAPLYAARATLPGRAATGALRDARRATKLDSLAWRYGKALSERLLATGDTTGAVTVAQRYFNRSPSSYILGLTLARALVSAQSYERADKLLASLTVLPYEGASEGHALYREAKLMLAVAAMRDRRWSAARAAIAAAREWPERLGAGKPYPADVDERLEDWLGAEVASRSGRIAEARATWARLAADSASRGPGGALGVLSLEHLSRSAEARSRIGTWLRDHPSDPWGRWLADRSRPLPDEPGLEARVLSRALETSR